MAIDAAPPQTKGSLPLAAVLGGVMALLGVVGFVALQRFGRGPSEPTAITAEAKAYVRNLKLADVEMKANASYLGQEVVEIVGKITNAGDRPLRQVDLNCIFYDVYNQVVLRERTTIVRPREGVFKPGDTRPFRLPFDNIPRGWNQTLPQIVIAGIVF